MYLHNKYTNWYNNIILTAKSRKLTEYKERHHIIPKSLGGKNTKHNLVELTAREHFICHWLLTKMTSGVNKQKMDYAFWMMINVANKHQEDYRYKVNSTTYSKLKIKFSKLFSNQHRGKQLSDEHKRKISETRKRKILSGEITVNENKEKYKIISEKLKGREVSEETRNKIGNAHKGKSISEKQREYMSKLKTGTVVNKEIKDKISKTLKAQYATGERKPIKGMLGKKLSDTAKQKMRKPKKRGCCPHCGKEGAINLLKRYHFDNCKFKDAIA